ncbi:uncharacterized protein EI97DRAFT_454936 [Westerdykella ornata]|uniref:Uncharacterized protein n=1 Tax=Westerdykella ornata TaxID=318751 RepID=A0A6A6JW05_WESOR|nr:uncharacterized protein EI97DRAFT_454936 [Westerdykella ornata]KAF2279998.1 hypothetical protein EI97DRAFT_454936 [Westerdykella ornata]
MAHAPLAVIHGKHHESLEESTQSKNPTHRRANLGTRSTNTIVVEAHNTNRAARGKADLDAAPTTMTKVVRVTLAGNTRSSLLLNSMCGEEEDKVLLLDEAGEALDFSLGTTTGREEDEDITHGYSCGCGTISHTSTSTSTSTTTASSMHTSTVFITTLSYTNPSASRTRFPRSNIPSPSASPAPAPSSSSFYFFHPHHHHPTPLQPSTSLSPTPSSYTAETLESGSPSPLSKIILALAFIIMAVSGAWVAIVYWVQFPPGWVVGSNNPRRREVGCKARGSGEGWRLWFKSGLWFGKGVEGVKTGDVSGGYFRLGGECGDDDEEGEEKHEGYISDGEDGVLGRRNDDDVDVESASGFSAGGNGMESAMSTATFFGDGYGYAHGESVELRARRGQIAQWKQQEEEARSCWSLEGLRSPDTPPKRTPTRTAATTPSPSSPSQTNAHKTAHRECPHGTSHTKVSDDGTNPTHKLRINLPSSHHPAIESPIDPPITIYSPTQKPPLTPSPPSYSSPSPSSPHNPFLPPPLPDSTPRLHLKQRRNSATWLREREAFFSSTTTPWDFTPNDPNPNPNPNRNPVPGIPSPGYSSTDSPTDLESQQSHFLPTHHHPRRAGARASKTGPQKGRHHRRRGGGGGGGGGGGNGKGEERSAKTWLEAVDGAVNRVVDKMVRWTDDRDGDEGLLLPVAEQ